jgi:ADP-ribose pyrophosphatase YjhB (NUDIX family)
LTSDGKIVLAKRIKGIVGGRRWHLPGGRAQFKETFETTLKRVVFAKTNLKVEFFYPSLKESLVGIYDNPEGDPREHVISIVFCARLWMERPNRAQRLMQSRASLKQKQKIWISPLTIEKLSRTLSLC